MGKSKNPIGCLSVAPILCVEGNSVLDVCRSTDLAVGKTQNEGSDRVYFSVEDAFFCFFPDPFFLTAAALPNCMSSIVSNVAFLSE